MKHAPHGLDAPVTRSEVARILARELRPLQVQIANLRAQIRTLQAGTEPW
ncbi:hypothetical protein LZ518_08150 [Sphingomonas sp. RB56-2]|uniref:Uncharacterized protein n=1 Tax=Sphingomonas brevis TaxID=2908206 RepID=A0ABT0S9L1_9SPHN|nr:hypothetical protein [Sphingomonas brevis]MCL6741100.1 hypothetical protein [Sphingomonas brevis]